MELEPYQPIISVILPTLNAERTLDLCLNSLRAQDYPRDRIEIVLADAGSTDGTLAIARRHKVDRIVLNRLQTGEAGKAAAIEASTGEILALIDSDNLFDDTAYFSRAAAQFSDPTVWSVEPLRWTFDPDDTLVNRYCALIGMNDPLIYFLGSYNRFSYLSGKFSGLAPLSVHETDDAFIVDIDPANVPTFGANGFMVRRSALEGIAWIPYYFDIDVFQQMVHKGRNRISVIKTDTWHLFCDSVGTFRRKQSRRIRDYLYHKKDSRRTFDYSSVPKTRYIKFMLFTVTVIPLLIQALRGYRRKPDSAWWFHPLACWITLWEYGWGTVRSIFAPAEYDRRSWRQ